ncbi:MAG: hypothetical protein ACHQ1H_06180, partial [Nitrososphaerales archaeon]
MASPVTITVKQVWFDGKMLHVLGLVAFGAGTYPAGGLTMPLNDPLIKAQRTPQKVEIAAQAAQSAQALYEYTYIPGSDNTNGLVKIFTAGAEVSAGSTPSGVT